MFKKRWLPVVAAACAAALIGGSAANATPVGTVDWQVTNQVGVMKQGCDQDTILPGATITCGVQVVASDAFTADEVRIAVRDPSGAVVDMTSTTNFAFTTSIQTFNTSKIFDTVGSYTYFFEYRVGTKWTTEEPIRSFAVTNPVPATPTVISLNELPNPSDTTQSVTYTAHIWAQSQTVSTLVFACRTSSGGNCDFGHQFNWAFNGTDQTFTASHTFTTTGTYTIWVAYQNGSGWHDLTPTHTQTVNAAPNGMQQPQGSSGGYTMMFQDEFNGTSVDTTKWSYRSTAESLWCTSPQGTGNPNNQQLEFDKPSNVTVSGGSLHLTAKPDSIDACGRHYNWSSGLITTRFDSGFNQGGGFNFRYGWIETSAKFAPLKGSWPAFWTWQAPGNNTWTETDVFEYYSDNKTKVYLSQHSGSGGGCTPTLSFDPTTAYHTYGANIRSTGTDFYIDGVFKCHAPGVPVGPTNLILDNFVYSIIPPDPGVTNVVDFDYVRAWS